MYSKVIHFQKLIHNTWVDQTLRVTDDSVWLHHNALSINNTIRSIIIRDIK